MTGWSKGDAIQSAYKCFLIWLANRGTEGNSEKSEILRKVREFIEKHGKSRFADIKDFDRIIHNRAGLVDESGEDAKFLFNSAGLREALKGEDYNRALKVLRDAGVLPPVGKDGRSRTMKRFGKQTFSLYIVDQKSLYKD